jgi:cell division protein ZapA
MSAREEHSQAQPAAPEAGNAGSAGSVVVEIFDQYYHLRGPDPDHMQRLAAIVDAKMRAVAQHGATVDSLRVAVLAALNLADELVRMESQREATTGSAARTIKSRTESLAEMLDAVLEDTRKAG